MTGQKRVGKTSLTLAAGEFAKRDLRDHPPVVPIYILWGQIAHEDSRVALRELGERIAAAIVSTLNPEVDTPKLEFTGSMAPIVRLADIAARAGSPYKYVIIIDEFDDIHTDLYMHGNLAETFFANIRALTTLDNIGVVLVGGENMAFIIDRQGQKLNKFSRIALDYYSREAEWQDFVLLVQKPTEGTLHWHDDAISLIFDITNGNPYFAKLVCGRVFARTVAERDADITSEEVSRVVASEIPVFDTNSFAHLWQDGIHKSIIDREPDILRRCRALVAIARTIRLGQPLTIKNISTNKHSTLIGDAELAAVLNEFVGRDVLRENGGIYSFALPIFGSWLTDIGISRLASDRLTEELAKAVQKAEDMAYVHSDEIAGLAKRWPTYQGQQVTSEEIRAWLEQVDGHRNQRFLFKILQGTKVYSEAVIREKLRTVHGFVRPSLPEFVQRRRVDRRNDVVITYVDGQGKSGQFYAARYAEENSISVRGILEPRYFSDDVMQLKEKLEAISALVIVDDIIATGQSMIDNLQQFLARNHTVLQRLKIPTFIIALTATVEGQENVRSSISKFGHLDLDLRVCDVLGPQNYAFSDRSDLWNNQEEFDRAKALCTDLGVEIYPDDPLGFGDQGLLIVFPETCPNNTLPILHSGARGGAKRKWTPLFPRLIN